MVIASAILRLGCAVVLVLTVLCLGPPHKRLHPQRRHPNRLISRERQSRSSWAVRLAVAGTLKLGQRR